MHIFTTQFNVVLKKEVLKLIVDLLAGALHVGLSFFYSVLLMCFNLFDLF